MGAEAWFCFKTFSGSLSLYHSLPASPRVRLVFCTERPGKDHRPRAPVPELFARKEDLYKRKCMALQCSSGPGGVCGRGRPKLQSGNLRTAPRRVHLLWKRVAERDLHSSGSGWSGPCSQGSQMSFAPTGTSGGPENLFSAKGQRDEDTEILDRSTNTNAIKELLQRGKPTSRCLHTHENMRRVRFLLQIDMACGSAYATPARPRACERKGRQAGTDKRRRGHDLLQQRLLVLLNRCFDDDHDGALWRGQNRTDCGRRLREAKLLP